MMRRSGGVLLFLSSPRSHRVTEKTLNLQKPAEENFAQRLGFSVCPWLRGGNTRLGRHRSSCWHLPLLMLFLLALPVCAQRRNDPLNETEIDQLRDAMMEPDVRLRLYVKFARDRMTKLEQMRVDPKTTNRALQTRDMLQDFLTVYGELDDNIDMYVGRRNDIRKPMQAVIEADTHFQSQLRALKDAVNADSKEAKQYGYLVADALDTVDSSAEDHRKTLAEVEEYVKTQKKQKEH